MTLRHLSLFNFIPIHWLFLGLFSGLFVSLNNPLLVSISTYLTTSSHFTLISSLLLLFTIAFLFVITHYKNYFCLGILLCFISLFINHFNFIPPTSYQQCKLNVIPYSVINSNSIRATYRLKLINGQCKYKKVMPQTILVTEYNHRFNLSKKLGKTLTVYADLSPIKGRINTNAWNKEKHYWIQNTYLQVKKITQLVPNNHDHFSFFDSIQTSLIQVSSTIRKTINHQLTDHLLSNFSSFSQAILIGDRSKLSSQQQKLLQRTGTSHLLAISGMHLSIIGGLFWLLFQSLWALSSRLSDVVTPIKAGAIISFLAITSYAVITGFNIPVQRAWLMFSLLIISWVLLKNNSSNSLFLAAVIILFIFPKSFFSVSFYFSFLATYTVISIIKLKIATLVKVLLIQVGIYIMLFPLIWYQFNSVPITSAFTNLLVIPWLSVVVFPILLCAVIYPTEGWVSNLLWQGTDHSLNALYAVLSFFDRFDAVIHLNQRIMLWQVLIAVICVLIFIHLCHKKFKKYYLIIPLIAYCLALAPLPNNLSSEIILSDSRFTKALFHNGKQAIMINPGYKNNTFNDAVHWKNYLKQSNITLSVIILQDDKISKISSTAYLKKHFPNASIITLSSQFLPFKSQFCKGITLDKKFKIMIQKINSQKCQLSILWEGEVFSIFNRNHSNYINSKSKIFLGNTHYSSEKYGEIKITKEKRGIKVSTLRRNTSPWYDHFVN